MSLSDLRCGVIGGAGMMGCKHIANLAAHLLGARVTALADPHPPSREAALGLAPGGRPVAWWTLGLSLGG